MNACVSVVIPTRGEALRLPLLLADLARGSRLIAEVLVVDGGSTDATVAVAQLAGARVLQTAPSRGGQLRLGLDEAQGPWLWLLHGDARLPHHWPARLEAVLSAPAACSPTAWYAQLQIQLPGLPYRLLELAVRWRSRWRQRPYGDQGLLIERRWYDQVGGIRPLPLMEDLEFAARFACTGRFQALALAIRVDGRRWQRLGLVGTTWANAALRRAWRRGAPAACLYGEYQNAQRWPWGSSSQP